jgi:hypothetical protein
MDFFDGLSEEATICISVISEMEDFAVLPIEGDDSMRASNLYARFHLSHGVGILDCLIASIAISRKVDFFSRNQKHFEMFPDMVRDNVTGLIWEVKTNDESMHNKDKTYTRYDREQNWGDGEKN